MGTIFQVLKMLGCLGMFLYGMSLMSGGLQKFAGNSLRAFIARMTSNTFKCVLTGLVVTALVQSSTATTLMLVSFVNAGLMSLFNAIGVIMGANIGTTLTAWLFAVSFDGSFSLGAIAVPLMFFAFVFLSCKKQRMKNFGEFLMGFALLFLGLSTLKETSFPLLASEAARNLVAPLTGFGFGSVLIFLIIGPIMTLMLQSSAATISITMLLLAAGVLPFNLAVAMVLGENIGTTITSNLAATVANTNAKRTARAHLVFNLFGSLLVIIFFNPYIRLNGMLVAAFGFPNPCTADFSVLGSDDPADAVMRKQLEGCLPYAIACVHSLFNICTTLILVGFIPAIERLVTLMVPSKEGEKDIHKIIYLSGGPLNTAELSLNQVEKEIVHFAEICYKDFSYIRQAINETDSARIRTLTDKLVKYEEITDRIEFEIATYLHKVAAEELSADTRERMKSMYRIIGEMESLGDAGETISRLLIRKDQHAKNLAPRMLEKINELLQKVDHAYVVMMDNLSTSDLNDISNAAQAEDAINVLRNALREEHVANLDLPGYDYAAGNYYMDIVNELESIGDFIINVSEAKMSMMAIQKK